MGQLLIAKEELDVLNAFYSYYIWISIVLSTLVSTGSFLICYVLLRYSFVRTTLNYYLFNMAIADMFGLVILAAPALLNASDMHNSLHQLITLIMLTYCGVTTLNTAAVAVNKYIGICHSLKSSYILTFPRTIKVITTIWGISFGYSAIYVKKDMFCSLPESWLCKEMIIILDRGIAIVFFILPLTIILVLHIIIRIKIWRSSRFLQDSLGQHIAARTELKLSEVVTLEFFFCSVPFHLVIYTFIKDRAFLINKTGVNVFMLTALLNVLYKSGNPVLYYCFCRQYRRGFQGDVNPHSVLEQELNLPGVTVWAGIWSGFIVGPYFFNATALFSKEDEPRPENGVKHIDEAEVVQDEFI